MDHASFQYAIEYLSPEGQPLETIPVEPDWGPAREWARLRAARQGALSLLGGGRGDERVEPVWDPEVGPPRVCAARIVVSAERDDVGGEADAPLDAEIPSLPYFRSAARQGSTGLVERGLLESGETFEYRVCAFPSRLTDGGDGSAGTGEDGSALSLAVEEVAQPYSLDERPLRALLDASTAVGSEDDPDELPVFIPQRVMDEAAERARDAGTVETGGILVGKLRHSPAEPDLFLEVTAQIPAPHTTAESARLTFTPDTWTAVRNAMALRRQEEVMCGWYHYHPRFCRKCPPEAQRRCVFARPFFSGEDVHLHRTVFPRAFHVALLISDLGEPELDASLFGWSRGLVTNRGFHILRRRSEPASTGSVEAIAAPR